MTTSRYLSRDEVRLVDRVAIEQLGLPGIVLMENAGRGATDVLRQQHPRGVISVCAGGGNNGGDGYVIARHLWLEGDDVRLLEFTERQRLTGDAAINALVAEKLGIPLIPITLPADHRRLQMLLNESAWIVDALLGTGLTSEVREPFRTAISEINTSAAAVLSVDLPSGLDCDSGTPLGIAVEADLTVTFVAQKLGFRQPESKAWTGEVHVVGIGVPPDLPKRFPSTT